MIQSISMIENKFAVKVLFMNQTVNNTQYC